MITKHEATERKHNRRGRPFTFAANERARLAELIRQRGIRGAQRAAGISVSINTLVKIGREFNIKLLKGRRRRSAASKD